MSRKELHEKTNLRPNTVGEIAGALLDRGLLREGESENVGVGRPRQLLEIDPTRLQVVGLALERGRVSSCRLNLHGQIVGEVRQETIDEAAHPVAAGCEMLKALANDQTLGIGLSTTGFSDPQKRSILTSSATLSQTPTSLECVYAAAGSIPIVVENDMHARATYWLLNQDVSGSDAVTRQDILLIELRDSAMGAALLVGGRPNRGCVIGANELGHMRFPVDTDVCFCGHTGCLEQIFSSAYLRRISNDKHADLHAHLSRFDQSDKPLETISSYIAMGIANAINFIRPDRVVIAGKILQADAYCKDLVKTVSGLLLQPLIERVHIGLWDKLSIQSSEAAAWLALADVYRGGNPEVPAGHGDHLEKDESTSVETEI